MLYGAVVCYHTLNNYSVANKLGARAVTVVTAAAPGTDLERTLATRKTTPS